MLKKLLGAFAVVALTLVVASSASAITVSELKALGLTDAQAEAIAAVLGASASQNSSVTCTAYTRDLTIGSTGSDVVALQDMLIANGNLVMPAGVSKGYFGALTQSALAKYQVANMIAPPAGYFGPITRASIKCSGSTTTPGSSNSGDLEGGAGDITVSEKSSGTEDEILEGEEEVPVLGFEVEAEGSDVSLTSVKVSFDYTGASAGSDKLDRYVDEVQIMLGDEVVGSADVDSFNENSDVYSESIQIDGAVIREDDKEKLYVSITATNNIDSDDLGEDWNVELDQIRFEDGEGAILTDSISSTIDATFTFEDLSTSGDIKLDINEDDETINAAHSVQVDDSDDTNDVEVLSFTLDAEGSDIFLNELSFDITSTGAGITEIANDFRLMMDGEEVGNLASSTASSSATTGTFVFNDLDDDDVVIEEGDSVTFELVADINDIEGGFSDGDTLGVSLDEDGVDAEDQNGDTVTTADISGSADSSDIEFLASGISVETDSTDADVDTKVSDVATDDEGRFEVVFVVKAVDEAAYIELGAATQGTTESNTGVNFVIQDADNSYAATTTGAISLSDVTRVTGGSVSGEFIKVNAGSEATFKLVVNFNPAHTTATSEAYRLRLYSVNFAATAANATDQQVLTPEVDYRTGSVSIGN